MSHVVEWRAPARSAPAPGRVRPLGKEDIPRAAELHRKLLGSATAPHEVESYLMEVFCRHPWRDPRMPSLVYEDGSGRIIGCLGVMPRPMWMEGRPIVAAVTHNFMVEPDRRSTLAAMQLIKAFFSGPQDLSVAEGNPISRKLWEGVGGTTSMLYSLRWTRPLRPARYALSLLEKRGLSGWSTGCLRPLSRVVDVLATRLPTSPLRQPRTARVAEELDPGTLLDGLDRVSSRRPLRPRYDRDSLAWLLEVLTRSAGRGTLRKILVRSARRIAGWYLYYVVPDGVGEVVQIGATEDTAEEVLNHLFHDAWNQGAIAVSGQIEPSLMSAFSEKFCLFHRGRGGSWVLVHTRHERILRAMQLGEAFFTRLEGEWWIAPPEAVKSRGQQTRSSEQRSAAARWRS